jgi:hypothetical protein
MSELNKFEMSELRRKNDWLVRDLAASRNELDIVLKVSVGIDGS